MLDNFLKILSQVKRALLPCTYVLSIGVLHEEEMCGKKMNEQTDSHIAYVHTCGSCKTSIPSLESIVVIDDFDLHIL